MVGEPDGELVVSEVVGDTDGAVVNVGAVKIELVGELVGSCTEATWLAIPMASWSCPRWW